MQTVLFDLLARHTEKSQEEKVQSAMTEKKIQKLISWCSCTVLQHLKEMSFQSRVNTCKHSQRYPLHAVM